MLGKKKAQGLSMNVIVIAAIALIVLVVIVVMLAGKLGSFSKGTDDVLASETQGFDWDDESGVSVPSERFSVSASTSVGSTTPAPIYEIPSDAIKVKNCETPLDQEGKNYVLENDVSSEGTCFTIGADDIKLYGQGKTITYAISQAGKGVVGDGFNRITIKDVVIEEGASRKDSGVGVFAIQLVDSKNSVIEGNKITNLLGVGIDLISSDNSKILSNTITTSGNTDGILLRTSSVEVISNTITTSGSVAGIIIYGSSNTIHSNIIVTKHTTAIESSAIQFITPESNLIYNNFIQVDSENAEFVLFTYARLGQSEWNAELLLEKNNIVGGPTIGGNYYARPGGKGFSEDRDRCKDEKDPKGICDDPLEHASGHVDKYPLTKFDSSQTLSEPPSQDNVQTTGCGPERLPCVNDAGEYYLSIQYMDRTLEDNENDFEPGSKWVYCDKQTDCVYVQNTCIHQEDIIYGWICGNNNLLDLCDTNDKCDTVKIGEKFYYCDGVDTWRTTKPEGCFSNQYLQRTIAEKENEETSGSAIALCDESTDCVSASGVCMALGISTSSENWICSDNNLLDKCDKGDECDAVTVDGGLYYCDGVDKWTATNPGCEKLSLPAETQVETSSDEKIEIDPTTGADLECGTAVLQGQSCTEFSNARCSFGTCKLTLVTGGGYKCKCRN